MIEKKLYVQIVMVLMKVQSWYGIKKNVSKLVIIVIIIIIIIITNNNNNNE